MQKRLAWLSVVAAMALPVGLEASSVCAVNAFGQFFRFEVKDRCQAGTNSMGSPADCADEPALGTQWRSLLARV